MSAIAGVYQFNNNSINHDQINSMMNALQQFPSNSSRVLVKNHLFMGCHAQWITHESVGEVLPFYDSDKKLAITADAIIDNRHELFERLGVESNNRKNMSDSELILLTYEKWHENSPKYLIGDFAFVIWDEKNETLFGARDFSGGRTLYFCHTEEKFTFCSTIKPLLLNNYPRRMNEQWLAEFLAISGMVDTVNTSNTPYKGINQLEPSHSFTLRRGKISIHQYCILDHFKPIRFKKDSDYIEAFRDVFQEAVSSRLRTHKKVGVQLSGGLDSGSIAAFASRKLLENGKKLHTYSYVPPEDFVDFTPRYLMPDETPLIKETVNFVGNIDDKYLSFEGRDSYSEIDSFLDVMEMPYKFFENSFWLKGMFEEAAKDGVGILLNGGRGNITISWGSTIEYYSLLFKKMKWIKLMKELHMYSINVGGSRYRRLPNIIKEALPVFNKKGINRSAFEMPSILNEELAASTDVYGTLKEHGIGDNGWFLDNNVFKQRKTHFQEVFHWNASNTLSSKLSYRYGLWKRDPTNDLRVIRYCLSLPEEQYVQNGFDRALIRNATSSYLPDSIRLNQSVRGVQGADWVQRMQNQWNSLVSEVNSMLSDPITSYLFNFDTLKYSAEKLHYGPQPEKAINPYYKTIMRSLIVYKFIKNNSFEGR